MKPTRAQVDYYLWQRSHIFVSRLVILGLIGFVTVTLKIGCWIDWSWGWALSPWWIGWLYGGTWLVGVSAYSATVQVQESETPEREMP